MKYRWIAIAALLTLVALDAPAPGQDEPTVAAEPQAAAPADPVTVEPQPTEPEPAVEPASQASPPRGAIVGGVTSAAQETVGKVRAGSSEVAQQGRAVWTDVLRPMWQRLAGALPGVLKALLVLAAFWILAVVLGAAVRKLLGLTKIDDRAARDWGLGNMLKTEDGKARSIEQLGGTMVKWLVLLFGFVAFFQAIDLSMVAGPLQGIVNRIVGVVPNLLQAAVILIAYWIVAALLRLAVGRGLDMAGFNEKASRFIAEREIKGEMVKPSGLVARLVFYVVLIFGLPPFLDALGQRSLVAPLSEMFEKAFGFLPSLVGAVVIFFIGNLIATIVKEIVTSFLAAAGADSGAQKLGLGGALEKLKLSEIAGSVAYFFIIVPVIGAAVEALGIQAVSEPVSRTLETLLAAVPLVFVAAVVVGVGYFLARIVRGIVESFLAGVGFDHLPEKLGLDFLKAGKGRSAPSAIAGMVVMLVIILLTAEQALATLHLNELSALIGMFIGYLPQVLVGLVVIVAALSLSSYAARLVESAVGSKGHGRVLSLVTRWAILVFGFGLGLVELGVGEDLISVAVGATLGGAALALGLAFGLGGRDRAQRLIEQVEAD